MEAQYSNIRVPHLKEKNIVKKTYRKFTRICEKKKIAKERMYADHNNLQSSSEMLYENHKAMDE